MSPSDTVYDRYKKTGYITGPNHRMATALNSAAPEPDEPESGGEGEPPNLRDAGDSMESCGDCEYFTPASAAGAAGVGPRGNPGAVRSVEGSSCSKFGDYPVTPNQVCDDYEPIAEEGGEGEEAEGPSEIGM